MGTVKPIPEGYHSITPYLYVKGAAKALDFYRKAFGATERMRMDMPDGTIGHAEIQIGDSVLMLADPPPRAGDARGMTGSLVLYVEDVDTVFKRAIDAGASEVEPLQDKFYGDRMGTLCDPFGFEWLLGAHIEDVSEEENRDTSITGSRKDLIAYHALVALKAAAEDSRLLPLVPRRLAERARKLGNHHFLLGHPEEVQQLLRFATRLDPFNLRVAFPYRRRLFRPASLPPLGLAAQVRRVALGVVERCP